jgi:hypothetical protein
MSVINILKGLALAFCILYSFNAIIRLVFNRLDQNAQVPADEKNMRYMPVIVVSSGMIDLVQFADLNEYQLKHPDFSFLIPQAKEEELQRKFQNLPNERNVDAYWTFNIEQRSEGRQSLHVSCLGDGATETWYEATDKVIYPKFVKQYGAGFVFAVAQYACPLTALIWLPNIAIYVWYRRRKKVNQ